MILGRGAVAGGALAATLLAGSLAFAPAQESAKEAAPAAARPAGLVCTIEPARGGGLVESDARLADRVALHVAAGEPASDLVAAGRFRATWRGALQLDLRSKLRFAARGRGRAKLSIGGQVVFEGGGDGALDVACEETRFPQGVNELLFEYSSPADGEATVRLLWSGRGFDWEPIPPALLSHAAEQEPKESFERRAGRELFAQRRCFACHRPEGEAATRLAQEGMPELAADAPDLRDAGARLRRDWIAHWVVAPRALRPQARMPRLLGAGDLAAHLAVGDARALDLAAYLATRGAQTGGGAEGAAAIDPARAAEGGRLFAQLGCIGCHWRPDAPATADAFERVPLHHVAWKWQPAALVAFLRAPAALDPWIRMPDLHLSEAEAGALAAFLLDRSARHAPPATPAGGDALRGEELYAQLGCARCHERAVAKGSPPTFTAIAAADWKAKGCAAEPDARDAACPDFELAAGERAALQRFGARGLATLRLRNDADAADRALRELQCVACHTIGAQRDRWQSLVVETADLVADAKKPELDQARPPLTWAGEKLHSDWIERLLSKGVEPRTRPWLEARMPSFPARATLLARGLAARDGFAPSASLREAPKSDAEGAAAKQLLFEKGFACDACHEVGDAPARSRFEFGAPNLAHSHARIRPDYYRRWMANPMRVEPSSKMPVYAGDDGKSPFLDVLDGDLPRQFEAIRLWLAELATGGR